MTQAERLARLRSHDAFFVSALSMVPAQHYFPPTDEEREESYRRKLENTGRNQRAKHLAKLAATL